MANKTITKRGALVRKFCEKHPELPHMTLARMVYAKHDALFPTLNAARMQVMYHRGKKRKDYKGGVEAVAHTATSSTVRHSYRAPKTFGKDRTDFVIHGAQRILRLSDIHFPIHDAEALNAAIDYGRKHDPTVILIDGDMADLSEFSTHEQVSLSSYVKQEMDMIAEFFDALRETFPKARIIWKEGNHEERFLKYLLRKAPELLATDCFDLLSFIRFISGRADATHRVEWVHEKRIIRAGKLAFLHGHEFRGGGGVNPARWLYLRTGENAICGHFHRTSEHSEPSLSGEQRGAWSTGCLCHLSPDYLRHNKWNHGFAWVDVDKAGNFRVKNIRILDGEIY